MKIKDKKFISFDMWNTLISPNTKFKSRRIQALASLLKPHVKYNLEALEMNVSHCLRQTKQDLDFMQESMNVAFTSLNCWKLFLHNLGVDDSSVGGLQNLSAWCLQTSNSIFLQEPPKFDPGLAATLFEFKREFNLELGISSNTNFVPGCIVVETLLQYPGLFDRYTFSDEVLLCKPDLSFFAQSLPFISDGDILHIGDNDVTDGAVVDYGIEFLKVKNPEDTLDKVKQFLHTLNN